MEGVEIGIVDMAIALVVGVSMLFGVMRGLLKEVVSLAIWATAALLGLALGESVGAWLGEKVGLTDLDPRLSNGVGFAIVVIGVFVVGALAQRMLAALVKATGLSGTDRMLGFAFGFVRGVALAVLGLVVLRTYADALVAFGLVVLADLSTWLDDSTLAPHLLAWEDDVLVAVRYLADLFGARFRRSPVQWEAL